MILDQREIQKRGGLAAKYPVAYIIAQFLKKYRFQKVLDVTYGRGRFYKIYRPRLLVGADPVKREWIVKPDLFFQKSVWSLRYEKELQNYMFDLIVVDPPWGDTTYRRRPEYREALGTPDLIIEYALKLARERDIRFVLVHYNKVPKLDGMEIIENIAFRPVARYLNVDLERFITYFTLYKL